MRALSVRQPYAELILRGIKPAEFRSRPTKLTGVPFYLYAARTPGDPAGFATLGCAPGELPTGVIVGVATITHCVDEGHRWAWQLADVRRLAVPLVPVGHPQPVWFEPFPSEQRAGGRRAGRRRLGRAA